MVLLNLALNHPLLVGSFPFRPNHFTIALLRKRFFFPNFFGRSKNDRGFSNELVMSTSGRLTIPALAAMKSRGENISVLTAYDYPTAQLIDAAGIEIILVGDSLGNVVQGKNGTLGVTLDEMIYHAEMVVRATSSALVVVDMPFPTFHLGINRTVGNAARIFKETGCQAVKLEGGANRVDEMTAITRAGMPVMAHIGLLPQSVHQLGGYRVQRDREQLIEDARAVESAGAFSVVLECIPAELAAEVTSILSIPTIGIGAGVDCDGQVLVAHDLLGLTPGRVPKHVKPYADLKSTITEAVTRFRDEVRDGRFPDHDRSFS
jgi:3-methyl-2-oxobutanoate hydroxymethyltransferase